MQSSPQLVSLPMQPPGGDAKEQQWGMPAAPPYYPSPRGPPACASRPRLLPRDFVLWSLFNFFFMNTCCLGFIALAYSFKSRDRKVVGDVEGATSYGRTAKGLNIAALLLSILFIVLFIVLLFSGVIALQEVIYQMPKEQRTSLDDYFQRNGK